MRTRMILAALLATAVTTPVFAQRGDGAERFGERGRQRMQQPQVSQSQPQIQQPPIQQQQFRPQPVQAEQRQRIRGFNRGDGPEMRNDGLSQQRTGQQRIGQERIGQQRIGQERIGQERMGNERFQRPMPSSVQTPVAQEQRDRRFDRRPMGTDGNRFRDRDGDGIRNRVDRDRDGDGIRNGREDRDRDGIPNFRDRDRDGDGVRNNRDWDRNNNGQIDRRFDRNRNGIVDRRFDRNNDGVRDNGNRWNNNQGWNRDWRQDRRYDWERHRYSNRNQYRLPRYYSPYGYNYSYQRFGIGVYLDNVFFGSRYRISDPYAYRLPAASWPYQWVRYYDDVLLVDTRNGYVVDVINNFFW